MSDRTRVFAALADPNRRQIIEHLVVGHLTTATELATELKISRQAVSKHLGLLSAAGLTGSTKNGRETRYASRLDALAEITQWISAVESQWNSRLHNLKDQLAAANNTSSVDHFLQH